MPPQRRLRAMFPWCRCWASSGLGSLTQERRWQRRQRLWPAARCGWWRPPIILHMRVNRKHARCTVWLTLRVARRSEAGCSAQVYKFERLQPLSYYASAEQRGPVGSVGLFWRGDPQQEALAARCRMLRYAPVCIMRANMVGLRAGPLAGVAGMLAMREIRDHVLQ